MKNTLVLLSTFALLVLGAAPAMALADLSVSYDYFFDGTVDDGNAETDLSDASLLRAKVGLIGFVAGLDYFTGSDEDGINDVTTTELKAGWGLGLVVADLDFLAVYNATTWDSGGEVDFTSYGVGVDATIKAIPFILLEGYYTYFVATEVDGIGVTSDEGSGSVLGIRATYNFFDGLGATLGYRVQTNEVEYLGIGYDVSTSGTSLGITYTF